MRENVRRAQSVTEAGLAQYLESTLPLQTLLFMVSAQRDTENNFLEVYLAYRRALISLMVQTFYDYENDIPMVKKFGVNP